MFERGRGLSLKMIQEVEVKEIVIGETNPEQIREIVEWFLENWLYTAEKCPTQVVSLDNEQVSLTLYDVWRMSGRIESPGSSRRADKKEKKESLGILEEDRFIPVPSKIMLGDGFRFCLIISIVLDQDMETEYI